MAEIDLRCILGEAGDILISAESYSQSFRSVPAEADGEYHRLTDVPPAIDVLLIHYRLLLLITTEGELLLVSDDHSKGIILDTGTPPLKKVIGSSPFSLLDIEDTLHFVDINEIIRQAIPNFYLFSDHQIDNPSINNVEWLIHHSSSGRSVDRMTIKTSEGLIGSPSIDIIKGSYIITDVKHSDARKIGNCFSYQVGESRLADYGTGRFRITDDIIDLVYAGQLIYLLNNRDELILLNDQIPDGVKKPNFTPTRFLKDISNDNVYIEDTGGNIYDAYLVITQRIPVESMDVPIILNGFKRIGRMTKRARHLTSPSQSTE